jgi:hypothetical protein
MKLQDRLNIKRGKDKTEGSNKLDKDVKRWTHSVLKRIPNLHATQHESNTNVIKNERNKGREKLPCLQ